jgi:hypothetical protein
MPKGQQKSNKEIKKPKKEKAAPAAPPPFAKGAPSAGEATKKKG